VKSICLIVQNFYEVDARVRRKAEALVSAGYSVDVLGLRAADGKKRYVLNGVNVHTISLGKQRGSLVRYLFEYAAFFFWVLIRLPLLMLRRHYAVIDVNTLPDFLIFAPIFARWMGAKLVLDMHEITPEFFISKYGFAEESRAVRLLKFQERISFDFADHVITINEPVQQLFEGRGLARTKSTIIMNSADERRFGMGSAATNPKVEGSSDAFAFMYHGTLTKIYGLDIAVEAFALAHQEMPGAEMWILGWGPESERLADLIRERNLSSAVKLVGEVRGSQIPGWLRRCAVGVLPIRRDVFLDLAFPNKLGEFIISGKPVIVSRLNAIRHYFSENALAFAEPNDPADLAKQMIRVYGDQRLRGRLRDRAREEYAAISWDVMRERYLAMIEGLIDPASQPARPPVLAQ
jgi:glycosyltransferase involved in cell wall biosynthesis